MGFRRISKTKEWEMFETIAQEYLKELVARNLILVDKLGSIGNVKFCKTHNLLRDLCLKEVEKERFYRVTNRNYPPAIKSERRVVFPNDTSSVSISNVLGSLSHARSVICDVEDGEVRLPHNLLLLRTFKASDRDTLAGTYFLKNVFELVNSRYLAVRVHEKSKFPSSINLLWNLHTLIISCYHYLIAPNEIWKLHQLRHLVFEGYGSSLRVPWSGHEIVIMENLHTLKGVENLILNEDVVKRIPNLKKLHVIYKVKQMEGANSLSYLQCLNKLENFYCCTFDVCIEYWHGIRLPHSLKKLNVNVPRDMELEDILQKIGSLPLLEKFVLIDGCFKTGKWETIEGQFQSLKFLQLWSCKGLEDWIVSDKSHFPLLQKLHLHFLDILKEIPSEVGEITTLKSIYLEICTKSVMVSAKKIVEEQEDLYGDQLDLHVRAQVRKEEEALKSLASANFEVIVSTL